MLAIVQHDNRDFDEDRSWWADAACDTGDAGLANLFFSEELQDIAAAKRICASARCWPPASKARSSGGSRGACGVGSSSSTARSSPASVAGAGHPKVPRPEDQLPDIPIPEHLRTA